MRPFRKTVLLMIPAFIFISLFSTSSFAGGKNGKKHKKVKTYHPKKEVNQETNLDWRDEIRYSQDYQRHNDCNLPPGLAKKGKVPPGWAKKCRHQEVKHHRKHHGKDHQEHYPEHDHKRTSRGSDKPSIDGSVDIGVGIHIPIQ